MHDLGGVATGGIALPEPVNLVVGRMIVLFAFCEVAIGICRFLVAGSPRPRLALPRAAARRGAPRRHGAPYRRPAGPGRRVLADPGPRGGRGCRPWPRPASGRSSISSPVSRSTPSMERLRPTRRLMGNGTAAPRRASSTAACLWPSSWRLASLLAVPGVVSLSQAIPAIPAILGGTLLFPLAQTLIASADGTPPFVGRLLASYRNPRSYLRGAVVGLGMALAFCPRYTGRERNHPLRGGVPARRHRLCGRRSRL